MYLENFADVNIVIDGRQYPQQVTVADITGLQGVLGLDFIVTHKCVLYMDKSIMRIDGVLVSMRPGDRKSCAHVCASEDVWIEPGEESIVWAYSEKCAMSFPGGGRHGGAQETRDMGGPGRWTGVN